MIRCLGCGMQWKIAWLIQRQGGAAQYCPNCKRELDPHEAERILRGHMRKGDDRSISDLVHQYN